MPTPMPGTIPPTVWVTFTKHTEDPKLRWLERGLDLIGVPHRRNGESRDAPILEVPESALDAAMELLALRPLGRAGPCVDDLEDDHPVFDDPVARGW